MLFYARSILALLIISYKMERKEYEKKKEKTFNRHHIIWQAEKALFNVFDERNVIRMEMNQHNALHALFKTLLTPKDQLEFLQQLFEPVLSKKAFSLLSVLCSMEDRDFYDDWLVKWYPKKSSTKTNIGKKNSQS